MLTSWQGEGERRGKIGEGRVGRRGRGRGGGKEGEEGKKGGGKEKGTEGRKRKGREREGKGRTSAPPNDPLSPRGHSAPRDERPSTTGPSLKACSTSTKLPAGHPALAYSESKLHHVSTKAAEE